jgi:DNA repair photolyase
MPRMRRAPRALVGLRQLPSVRLESMRVTSAGQRDSGAAGQFTAQPQSREASGQQEPFENDAPQLDLLPRRQDRLPRSPSAQGAPAPLPILDTRARGTRFIQLPVRSVLNTPASTGMGFWSINPYVGCEFGCTYCYARDTHRWVVERRGSGAGGQEGSDSTPEENTASEQTAPLPHRPAALPAWEAFEKEILVKSEVAEVLARTLNPARMAGHSLVIGTATDPYQPAERRFRLTRRILEVLRAYHGLSIGIITKSALITRDLDVLQALSEHNEVTVNISLATADARLARRLELRSPMPAARLRALRRLTDGGIYAGLIIAPIVPGVTDDWAGLAQLIEAGKEAGARYVVGSALRLGPAARHRFLPHLEREFPELAERYRRHYAGKDHVSQTYQDALTRRLRLLQQAYGFPVDEAGGRRRRRQQLEGRAPRADAVEQVVLL